MQSCRIGSGKRPNSRQRQNRAVVNLRQLSENTWMQTYDDKSIPQQSISDELIHHTIQSAELPLHSKQYPHFNNNRLLISNIKQRPSTIQHYSLQTSNQRRYKVKPQLLTSFNFYQNQLSPSACHQKQRFVNNNASAKLNQDLEIFISRIKQQNELIQSIQSGRSKCCNNIKNANTSISIKSNAVNKSLFYKQVKNYLFNSFKVDGKPVQIKFDRYSIDSHGLPKRKSIYSFIEQKNVDSQQQKTQLLLKKVQRYQLEDQEKVPIKLRNSVKIKSTSLYDNAALGYAHQTLHMRQRNDKKKPAGKLWLGRPPTKLLIQDSDG